MKIVPLIKNFFEILNNRGIEYCHWKSNHLIQSFLQGKGDLDILVSSNSRIEFESILSEFNFKSVTSPAWEQTDSVYHYYGLDEETGSIVHLHVYFKLITGGNLIKNYHLPLTELLLKNSYITDGIKIPDRPSELLVFIIRKILECGSLPDFLFVLREEDNIKKEFCWLSNSNTVNEAKELLLRNLPEFNPLLFDECIQAVQSKSRFFHNASLSKKLQKIFSDHAINLPMKNKWLTWRKFFYVLFHKFISKKNVYGFSSGGVFIAFVGADASGKSTHAGNTSKWLRKFANTQRIHSGLPPATWLTFIPRIFLPAFRKLLPSQRTNFIELKHHSYNPQEYKDASYSILFLIRSIMIAFDQKSLINKVHLKAEKGAIIISDRYPSATLGGMDGPRVDPSFFDTGNPLKRFLASIIKNIYSNISKPDIVFKLSVPFEVNMQRLLDRGEEIDSKTEEQMRSRRAVMDKWELPTVPVHKIDNSTPFEDVQKKIRNIIWDTI
jgi:thymidylate kinase